MPLICCNEMVNGDEHYWTWIEKMLCCAMCVVYVRAVVHGPRCTKPNAKRCNWSSSRRKYCQYGTSSNVFTILCELFLRLPLLLPSSSFSFSSIFYVHLAYLHPLVLLNAPIRNCSLPFEIASLVTRWKLLLQLFNWRSHVLVHPLDVYTLCTYIL